jgi:hypothetical protein
MVATDGFYCGGAHPEDDLTALVFDMETGKQVDWKALVAKSSGASSPKNPPGDGEGTRPLMLPELQVIYAAAEETYCKDYFEDEQAFVIWPDAERNADREGCGSSACCCALQERIQTDNRTGTQAGI